MMVKALTTAALSVILAANAPAPTPADKAGEKSVAKATAAEPKYCITFEPSTESRIAKRECRTKSEWAQLGINVEDLHK